jgi:hypothetical protein
VDGDPDKLGEEALGIFSDEKLRVEGKADELVKEILGSTG